MITIDELIYDDDFSTNFTVLIDKGCWDEGNYVKRIKPIDVVGVARPTSADDINMLPEGDRVQGTMTFYSKYPLLLANSKYPLCVRYQSREYKLVHAENYGESGFYKAIGSLQKAV